MNENKTESPDEESAAECETRWVAKKTERRSPISGPSVKRESHRDSFMRCQLGKSRYQSKRKKQNKTKQNRRRTKTRTHSAASINPKPARWKERNKKKQLKNAVKHRISGNILWGDRAVLLFGGTRNKEEEEEKKTKQTAESKRSGTDTFPPFFFWYWWCSILILFGHNSERLSKTKRTISCPTLLVIFFLGISVDL